MNEEQNTALRNICDRLSTGTSKVEMAKHYSDDVQFLIELVCEQRRDIETLEAKVKEITIGEHEQAYKAVKKILEVCAEHRFMISIEG